MYQLDKNKTYYLTLLIIFAVAAFNLFFQLGNFPIYSWDEARHGVSAYEMLIHHNYIINTYRNKYDYWNLKPPLSFWTIILGYKLAGLNALGLRLCSAFLSLCTMLAVTLFVLKRHGKLASIITLLVLATCTQYITNHCSRTGDADSLFIFLFTIAILSLLKWEQCPIWLYISGLAFSLAFLTKSWHSGNIAIIIGLYLLFTGKFRKLSYKNWLILFICMVLPIFIWGIFRYQYDGFLFFQKMISYDLFQRSTSMIEGHTGGILYYVFILKRFFSLWMLFILIMGFLFIYKQVKKRITVNRSYLIGIGLWLLIPFLLFTIAKTKVRWYIIPVYPPLSIMAGAISSKLVFQAKQMKKVFLLLIILVIALFYENQMINYLNHPIPNFKQDLIEKIANHNETKGDPLYIYQPQGKIVWLQSEVLTAELADNLHVQNGDFKEFLQTNKALVLVPKKFLNILKSNKLQVIATNQWGDIATKRIEEKQVSL